MNIQYNKIIPKLRAWLLPHTCVVCDKPAANLDLCDGCQQHLPLNQNACRSCAYPLVSSEMDICGHCLVSPIADKIIVPWQYAAPIDHMVVALKFSAQFIYARLFSELMQAFIKQAYTHDVLPEVIIPVPLHARRISERGFNQSMEIARYLSKYFRVPIDFDLATRKKHTTPQAQLSAKKRLKNVAAAFAVKPNPYSHVALIDDVITTGQTLRAMTASLRARGIKRIDVWAVARAKME